MVEVVRPSGQTLALLEMSPVAIQTIDGDVTPVGDRSGSLKNSGAFASPQSGPASSVADVVGEAAFHVAATIATVRLVLTPLVAADAEFMG